VTLAEVLLISTAFPPLVGGIETFAVNIARGLKLVGCGVRVLTSAGRGKSEQVHDISIVRTLSWLNLKYLKIAPLLWTARRMVLDRRPDTIVAMTWTHEGIVAFLLRWVLGVEYVVVAHGSEILQHRRWCVTHWVMQRVLARAACVVVNSRFTHELVVGEGIKSDRIVVIHPPIDPAGSLAANARCVPDDLFDLSGKRVVLTVARLVERKGHTYVLRVLSRLAARYPDVVYVVAGDGECREQLERLATTLGIAGRVRMTGRVSETELRALYRRAEIYISPSLDVDGDVEGFGVALAEAGSYGIPVIAGRSGGVADAVLDGETGIIVRSGDEDELLSALGRLLDDPDFGRRLGENARRRATTELTIESQGRRFAETLDRLNHSREAVRGGVSKAESTVTSASRR